MNLQLLAVLLPFLAKHHEEITRILAVAPDIAALLKAAHDEGLLEKVKLS